MGRFPGKDCAQYSLQEIEMKRLSLLARVLLFSLLPTMAALASPPVKVIQAFNPAYGQLPESITADEDGSLYFSMAGGIHKYTTDHQIVQLATIPVPVQQGASVGGVKIGPNGYIYATVASFNPALSVSSVWRVSPDGQKISQFVSFPSDSLPNDLVFDPQGNMYITDSSKGQLWKVDQTGKAEVWLTHPLLAGSVEAPVAGSPLGANGIAFDRFRRNLYVMNTDFGRIVRVGFRHGRPQDIKVVTTNALLKGGDGIAFDVLGHLYVANNGADRIVVVSPFGGSVSVLVDGTPLDAPSSLVFGAGRNDRHTLYVTNFAIMRFNGFKPGAPQPSLVSLPVFLPGLDLVLP
jgi:sugar lactone lactonase YvrE